MRYQCCCFISGRKETFSCLEHYIHTYHSRFIPEVPLRGGITDISLDRDAHVLPKLLSYEEYYRRDRW
jgi:hypothetical protein